MFSYGFFFICLLHIAFHYVGQVHENSFLKIAFDQITDGQLCFAELDPHVDTVVIGMGKQYKQYTIYSGKRQMEAHLKKQFPNDTKAIEEFFKIMKVLNADFTKLKQFGQYHLPHVSLIPVLPK